MSDFDPTQIEQLGGKAPYTPPVGPNGTYYTAPGGEVVPPDRVRVIKPALRPPHEVWYKRVWVWLSSWVATLCYTSTKDRIKQYNTLTQGLSAVLLRVAEWWFKAPLRVWSIVEVFTGGKVSPLEKAEKDAECAKCPFRAYRMRRVYTHSRKFRVWVWWPFLLGEIALSVFAFCLTFWDLLMLCQFVVMLCVLHTWLGRKFATVSITMDEYCGKCGCPDWILSRNSLRNWYRKWLCPVFRHKGVYPDQDLKDFLKALTPPKDKELRTGTGCGCGKR